MDNDQEADEVQQKPDQAVIEDDQIETQNQNEDGKDEEEQD